MTLCDDIGVVLGSFQSCDETSDGACLSTHCLYPSFEPVSIYVVRYGGGYRVHDAAGAFKSAWAHGRDGALIRRMLTREASRFHSSVKDDAIYVDAVSTDWLLSAVLAVANASASAAHAAVWRISAASERTLADEIQTVLARVFAPKQVAREFPYVGTSGKTHNFDFAVHHDDHLILLDAVSPHPVSIAAKYVAFADTRSEGGNGIERFAVFDRPLERDDRALLGQVADLVPLKSLEPGVRRTLVQ